MVADRSSQLTWVLGKTDEITVCWPYL